MVLAGRGRTRTGHQNHRPSNAAIDGVMNARTTSVSKSRPRANVVPIWPRIRRSAKTNDAMVAAKTSPADVTTDPLPAMARTMPVLRPAWISSLKRAINSRL